MLKHLIIVGFISAAAAFPAVAQVAQPAGEVARTVPVRYADLDLRRTEDAQMMLSRLRYAAWVVCVRAEAASRASVTRAETACQAEALANAVANIDAPELTRAYAAQTQR